MPSYERTARFAKDWAVLDPASQARFRATVAEKFVPDLVSGRFRSGLGVKPVEGTDEPVWELRWAPDGRATWQYGPERFPGTPHVIWRRIGTHDIYRAP
ncbi:MAG: hypothetical protein JWM67_3292 [Mycobacterium sp.]|nr:hypothetical protein [Mycobacterium sp.]